MHICSVNVLPNRSQFECDTDSPLFRKRIELLETEEVWLGDRGRLAIERAELADKGEDSPRREASLMHGGAALETSLTTETGG